MTIRSHNSYHGSLQKRLSKQSLNTVADIKNITFDQNGGIGHCNIDVHTPQWNIRLDKNMVIKYNFKKSIKKQCKDAAYKSILLFYLFLNVFEYYNVFIQWHNIVFDENSSYWNGTGWYKYSCLNMMLWSNDNIKDIVFGVLLLQIQMYDEKIKMEHSQNNCILYSFCIHTIIDSFIFYTRYIMGFCVLLFGRANCKCACWRCYIYEKNIERIFNLFGNDGSNVCSIYLYCSGNIVDITTCESILSN